MENTCSATVPNENNYKQTNYTLCCLTSLKPVSAQLQSSFSSSVCTISGTALKGFSHCNLVWSKVNNTQLDLYELDLWMNRI